MKTLLAFLLLVFIAPVALAQTVEFEVPSEIRVVPDRLVVTFAEAVGEDAARALLEGAGHEMVAIDFTPLVVVGAAPTPVEAAMLDSLRADARVLAVEQVDLYDAPDTLAVPPSGPMFGMRYHVSLRLSPSVGETEARALLVRWAPGVLVDEVVARPGEIIIAVEEARAEAVIAALDESPLVKYVTYLATYYTN